MRFMLKLALMLLLLLLIGVVGAAAVWMAISAWEAAGVV